MSTDNDIRRRDVLKAGALLKQLDDEELRQRVLGKLYHLTAVS